MGTKLRPERPSLRSGLSMPLVLDAQMAAELKRADRLTAMEGSGLINGTEYAKRCDVIQSRLGQIDAVNSSGEKHPRFFLALNGVDTNDISDKLEKAVDTFGAGGMSLEGAYRYAKVIGPLQESEDELNKQAQAMEAE